MNLKYSRRAFLASVGAGVCLLPILNNEAHAGDAGASSSSGFPLRFIAITWTNGVYGSSKWSTASAPLTTSNLPSVMSPLAPYVGKMILPRGVNNQAIFDATSGQNGIPYGKYGGHGGYPSILTGTQYGSSPSIDVLISQQLSSQGVANRQLNLGALPEGTYTSWSSTGHNSQVTNPYTLFNQLFPGATTSASQLSSIAQRRSSVLDTVTSQLTAFQNVVGTDDKVKIQSHLDSVRQLEMDLQTAATTCTPPALTPTGLTFSGISNYPTQVNFLMRLASAAITCGISRSVTIDLINDGGGDILTFPWLTPAITSPDYHAIAHAGASDATQKTAIDTWWYKQVATLVGGLADATEGSTTALDNSVVLLCNDMREGNDHYTASIPYVMIGSCGGHFKTGQIVGLNNAPNNQLLTSICHGMGLPVAGVGNAKYSGNLDSELT